MKAPLGTICATAVVLLWVAPASPSGFPPGVNITAELRVLGHAVACGAPIDVQQAFADTLGRYSIEWLDDETLSLMTEHFETFEPLVIRAQAPGYYLDRQLHEWFMAHSDSSGRRAMVQVLRSWLSARMSEAPFGGRGYRRSEKGRPEIAEREILRGRVRAAEMLSDLGDVPAVPLMKALQESIVQSAGGWDSLSVRQVESWWHLEQSLRRAADPRGGQLLMLDPAGLLAVYADTSDVAEVLYGDIGISTHPSVSVDRRAGCRVLELLAASAEHVPSPMQSGLQLQIHGDGLVVQLDNGAAVTVRPMKDGGVICHDNLRQSRPKYIVRSEELTALVEDIRAAYVEERGTYRFPGAPR